MAQKKVNLNVLARSAQAMTAMSEKTSQAVLAKVKEAEKRPGEALMLPLADIVIRKQVRSDAEEGLDQLVGLLEETGKVHTPIAVIPFGEGKWLLVAGERRVRGSLKLGWQTIPANVLYDVDELQVRTFQVQENSGRKDPSIKDVVLGVIEDYKLGGYERATAIWGHSKPWLAKRVAFDGYRPEIKELLLSGKTDDLELLGSLEGLSKTEGAERQYERFMSKLASGGKVGRDEVRLSHQSFKTRNVEAANEEVSASVDAGDEEDGLSHGDGLDLVGLEKDKTEDQTNRESGHEGGDLRIDQVTASGAAKGGAPRDGGAAEGDQPHGLDEARAAVYNKANGLKTTIARLRKEIKAEKLSVEDEEWVMWCAFLDVVSPALALLGPVRSTQALRALLADLKKGKGRDIGAILNEIHYRDGDVMPSPCRPDSWMVMSDPVEKN